MINPMTMLRAFINMGGGPQQFIQNIGTKNPMILNLMNLARKGDTKNLETFADNFCKERGIDMKEEFPKFMKMVKGK